MAWTTEHVIFPNIEEEQKWSRCCPVSPATSGDGFGRSVNSPRLLLRRIWRKKKPDNSDSASLDEQREEGLVRALECRRPPRKPTLRSGTRGPAIMCSSMASCVLRCPDSKQMVYKSRRGGKEESNLSIRTDTAGTTCVAGALRGGGRCAVVNAGVEMQTPSDRAGPLANGLTQASGGMAAASSIIANSILGR